MLKGLQYIRINHRMAMRIFWVTSCSPRILVQHQRHDSIKSASTAGVKSNENEKGEIRLLDFWEMVP